MKRLPIVLLALGVLVAGCAVDDEPKLALPTSAFISEPIANVSISPVGDRDALPDIAGLKRDDRPMVINAWASWCEPCRVEAPELAAFAAANPDIRMVGLNVNDEPGAAQAFAAATGMDYEQVTDADGSILATIPGIPPAGLPSTVVIDSEGNIAARIIGPVNGALQSTVDEALSKS